jgi:hypothetical protein
MMISVMITIPTSRRRKIIKRGVTVVDMVIMNLINVHIRTIPTTISPVSGVVHQQGRKSRKDILINDHGRFDYIKTSVRMATRLTLLIIEVLKNLLVKEVSCYL